MSSQVTYATNKLIMYKKIQIQALHFQIILRLPNTMIKLISHKIIKLINKIKDNKYNYWKIPIILYCNNM